jgi:radical SAM superfamily enzyme YgiQ (UPF0313 family)
MYYCITGFTEYLPSIPRSPLMLNCFRLLLIEPPFYRLFKDTYALVRYPLSLGYLAVAVKMHSDWEVVVYNSDFLPVSDPFEAAYFTGAGFKQYQEKLHNLSANIWQEIKAVIRQYMPQVIGISAKSANFASARRVAGLAKEVNPDIRVIVGGPHPSLVGKEVLTCQDIDLGVIGEGENTLVELLASLTNQGDLSQVPGLSYRQGGEAYLSAPRAWLDDLDQLGFPHQLASEVLHDYPLYPLAAFSRIFATRGCPYNCFFCSSGRIWGKRVRFRSPKNVVQEMWLLHAQGIKTIHFDDDTFGGNNFYLRALTKEISETGPGLPWSCEIHVKLVTPENIALMKKAGCALIQLGIESGNNGILREIRKGFTIEEAKSACQIITAHDISLETFFMAGFPQDTEATLKDSLAAIESISCDKVIYSIFTPYPGTEAFAYCQAHQLIDHTYDPALYYHQSPVNCFCRNLTARRFREISQHIEAVVQEKNRQGRIRKAKPLHP